MKANRDKTAINPAMLMIKFALCDSNMSSADYCSRLLKY